MRNYRHLILEIAIVASLVAAHTHTQAQCSMCRDSTAGSVPQVREGLRRAIPVLGIPAIVIFSGIFFLAFRLNKVDKDNS